MEQERDLPFFFSATLRKAKKYNVGKTQSFLDSCGLKLQNRLIWPKRLQLKHRRAYGQKRPRDRPEKGCCVSASLDMALIKADASLAAFARAGSPISPTSNPWNTRGSTMLTRERHSSRMASYSFNFSALVLPAEETRYSRCSRASNELKRTGGFSKRRRSEDRAALI